VKLATCNVNGFNVRLEILLKQLEEAEPGVGWVQELTAPQETLGAAGV
jgi:exonuclease III